MAGADTRSDNPASAPIGLSVAAGTILGAASFPPTPCTRLNLRGVFPRVAPVAQPLKVLKRVVHVIAVPVVDLATARLAAPLTRGSGLQPLRCIRRAGTRPRPPIRVQPLSHTLALRTTEPTPLMRPTPHSPRVSVHRILTARPEQHPTHHTRLLLMVVRHLFA